MDRFFTPTASPFREGRMEDRFETGDGRASPWFDGPRREAPFDAVGGALMLAVGIVLSVQTVPLLVR